MSVKAECRVLYDDDDVESGQCSEDDVHIVKKEKKSRKHKKTRKSRKRKHSSSSSNETIASDFFNPYYVNPEKFIFKTENINFLEDVQENNNDSAPTPKEDIIEETFNNLSNVDCERNISPGVQEQYIRRDPAIDLQLKKSIEIKENVYNIDISGIDSVTSDLYHYLSDYGISPFLIDDILKVYSMEEEEEAMAEAAGGTAAVDNDEEDGYEEEMINNIPIIDHNSQSFNGGYSPEHVGDVIEPYQPHLQVAYAPTRQTVSHPPVNHIIDPFSIPEVGPRDPRLANNNNSSAKSLLQMKPSAVVKPMEVVSVSFHKQLPPPQQQQQQQLPQQQIPQHAVVANADWETTVLNVVKTHLRLYLTHNDINKEEYKSILKRAVNKILTSGEKKLETDKISKFLHSYVTMVQKSRLLNNL